ESKFHLQRYIVACVQRMQDGTVKVSNECELKDTLLLREEIEELISTDAREISNIDKSAIAETKSNQKISKETVYNHFKELPEERRKKLIQTLQNGENTDQRMECIMNDVDYFMQELRQKFR